MVAEMAGVPIFGPTIRYVWWKRFFIFGLVVFIRLPGYFVVLLKIQAQLGIYRAIRKVLAAEAANLKNAKAFHDKCENHKDTDNFG